MFGKISEAKMEKLRLRDGIGRPPERIAEESSSGHLTNWLQTVLPKHNHAMAEAATGKLAQREAEKAAREKNRGWGRAKGDIGGDGGE